MNGEVTGQFAQPRVASRYSLLVLYVLQDPYIMQMNSECAGWLKRVNVEESINHKRVKSDAAPHYKYIFGPHRGPLPQKHHNDETHT